MAKIIASRVKETSTTTGTGNFTLAGAASGMRAFSSVCSVDDSFEYFIDGGSEWESGIGIYSATNTLKRLIVLSSTNTGSAVNFSAGTKNVWIDASANSFKSRRPDQGYFAHWNNVNQHSTTQDSGFTAVVSGGTFNSAAPSVVAGIVGGAVVSLGTTTTARAALVSRNLSGGDAVIALGSGLAHYKGRMQISQLSNGTDTYKICLGVQGGESSEPPAGVYFRYSDSVNSGKWQAVTKQANTETATYTGVTAQTTTASTFEIWVDNTAANAYFFIDGTLVATNTTNIPTGTASNQQVGYGVSFNRSAGTASLTAGTAYFQMFSYFYSSPF